MPIRQAVHNKRILLGVTTNTDVHRTRPLDDQGLFQLQQAQMDKQDAQLAQLTSILQRQKQLGVAIGNEVGEQIEMLDELGGDSCPRVRPREVPCPAVFRELIKFSNVPAGLKILTFPQRSLTLRTRVRKTFSAAVFPHKSKLILSFLFPERSRNVFRARRLLKPPPVQVFARKSTSAQVAPRTSPDLAAVRIVKQ